MPSTQGERVPGEATSSSALCYATGVSNKMQQFNDDKLNPEIADEKTTNHPFAIKREINANLTHK